MRTIPRNRRYIDILSLSISLFLFLAIFANCSTGFQIPLDDHLQADREDSLFVSRHTSVNIVTVDVRSVSQSHRALTNSASRKSTAFKTFKSVLAACSVVCMCISISTGSTGSPKRLPLAVKASSYDLSITRTEKKAESFFYC